jgi:hypothetical protein
MLAFVPGKPFESEVCQIAVQLLGPDLILPDPDLPARTTSSGGARACGRRTRGDYHTLPKWEPKPEDFIQGGAHQEGHPFQLGYSFANVLFYPQLVFSFDDLCGFD